jgi:hypothetical protein
VSAPPLGPGDAATAPLTVTQTVLDVVKPSIDVLCGETLIRYVPGASPLAVIPQLLLVNWLPK